MSARSLELPPFGFLAEGFQMAVPQTPQDWAKRVLEFSSSHIWPQWDQTRHAWSGGAAGNMVTLTRQDLCAIERLQPGFQQRARNTQAPGPSTHGGLFEAEDDLAPPYDSKWRCARPYGYGVPLEKRLQWVTQCSELDAERLAVEFRAGCGAVSSGLFWLKWMLQRPRPHQAAFLIGGSQYSFPYQLAKSAWSPSAISGHALQGLMGCLYAYLRLPAIGSAALADLGVDIGDRRVLAGVHYPTDNLLSWFAAWEFVAQQERSNEWAPAIAHQARAFIQTAVRGGRVLDELRGFNEFPTWQAAAPELLTP